MPRHRLVLRHSLVIEDDVRTPAAPRRPLVPLSPNIPTQVDTPRSPSPFRAALRVQRCAAVSECVRYGGYDWCAQSVLSKPGFQTLAHRDAPAEVSGRGARHTHEADQGNHAGQYTRQLSGPTAHPQPRSTSARGQKSAAAPRFMLSPEELHRAIQVYREGVRASDGPV